MTERNDPCRANRDPARNRSVPTDAAASRASRRGRAIPSSDPAAENAGSGGTCLPARRRDWTNSWIVLPPGLVAPSHDRAGVTRKPAHSSTPRRFQFLAVAVFLPTLLHRHEGDPIVMAEPAPTITNRWGAAPARHPPFNCNASLPTVAVSLVGPLAAAGASARHAARSMSRYSTATPIADTLGFRLTVIVLLSPGATRYSVDAVAASWPSAFCSLSFSANTSACSNFPVPES